MGGDKKIIYFLIAVNIFLAILMLIKIKMTPKYNPPIYEEVYAEYENIFGNNENDNIQESFNIINHDNDNKTMDIDYTESSNTVQGNVIGKIIIPKIDIKYPIIKETTAEYLKVAPTKYCGPEVNEIRKFSYSGS